MLSKADILDAAQTGRIRLPPLDFRVVDTDQPDEMFLGETEQPEAVIEAYCGEQTWRFVAEIRSLSTPKSIRDAASSIQIVATRLRMNAIIIVPYLSPAAVASLEKQRLSGIDLCGNGVVMVPGMLVARTGEPNRFPQSSPIRNVFRGDSSLVARAFFVRPEYRKVGDVLASIRQLGGDVTLPTVSKVLKVLEEQLIVDREAGVIRLIQPDKLLDALAANYRPPVEKERYVGKVRLDEHDLQTALADAAGRIGARFVLTGAASATKYAVLASEPIVAAYCDRSPEELLAALPQRAERTDRFPNLDLRRTQDALVYFDARKDAGVPYASPVQSYLELVSGDKRQQETAEQVRAYVLRPASSDRSDA